MSGLRGRLNKFRTAEGTVHFRLSGPEGAPAGPRVLLFLDADERAVGQLDHQVCAACATGHISNIAVATHWQGRGVAREALTLVLDGAPDHHWTTSRQTADGRGFFAALAEETGMDFEERGKRCCHMTGA